MGVHGLTTFINQRQEKLYKKYILHNSKLIIDGSNLMYSLSNRNFRDDYSEFAKCVEDFFNTLLRCKIESIVLLDGGWLNRKLQTKLIRRKQKLTRVTNYNKLLSDKASITAYLSYDVFVDVLKKMKINFVICFFEADNDIVSLSDLLNCPILSYDSDFYIYGSQYIPLDTLDGVIEIPGGFGMRCQIYNKNNLLRMFQGLTLLHLPIISILIGNDYVNKCYFNNFMHTFKFESKKDYGQKKINAILNWTKQKSVEELIEIILCHVKPEKRQFVLDKIENIINMYFTKTVSEKILVALKIDENMIVNKSKENFKFQKDIFNLKPFNFIIDSDGNEIKHNNYKFVNYLKRNCADENEYQDDSIEEIKFANLVPEWFQRGILCGDLCCSFINIITHQMYLTTIQVEDFTIESSNVLSFPIIETICSLLLTRNNLPIEEIRVQIIHQKQGNLFWSEMKIPRALVTLENLNNWDLNERIKVFNKTMKISDSQELDFFPKEWQLYIVAILYWMRNTTSKNYEKTDIHLNAIVLSMLNGVVKGKNYALVNSETLNEIRNFKREKYFSIKHCLNSLNEINCYSASLFFEKYFNLDFKKQNTLDQSRVIQIIHTFSQFQNVLKHTIDLNNLLGFIYPNPKIDQLYNGILINNFCTELPKKLNIYNYIVVQLRNSPPIFYLYEKLYQGLRKMLENFQQNNVDQPSGTDEDELDDFYNSCSVF